jgi:hypothetical protein
VCDQINSSLKCNTYSKLAKRVIQKSDFDDGKAFSENDDGDDLTDKVDGLLWQVI